MRYDDQFADGFAQLADDLADMVVYTPTGSEPIDISIIVGPEAIEETMEMDGVKRKHIRFCSVPSNLQAAGGGPFIAEVTIHDIFTFGGVGYMVNQIVARTATMTRVKAVRLAVHEQTREMLRRRN